AVNLTGNATTATVVVSAGASSLVNSGTTLYNSSSTQQQLVSITASSATGPSVDSVTIPKLSRKLWLSTQEASPRIAEAPRATSATLDSVTDIKRTGFGPPIVLGILFGAANVLVIAVAMALMAHDAMVSYLVVMFGGVPGVVAGGVLGVIAH